MTRFDNFMLTAIVAAICVCFLFAAGVSFLDLYDHLTHALFAALGSVR